MATTGEQATIGQSTLRTGLVEGVTDVQIRAAIAAHRKLGRVAQIWLLRLVVAVLLLLVDPFLAQVIAFLLALAMAVLFLMAISDCLKALGGNRVKNMTIAALYALWPLLMMVGSISWSYRLKAFWEKLGVEANLFFGPSEEAAQELLRQYKVKGNELGSEHLSYCKQGTYTSKYSEVNLIFGRSDSFASWLSDLDLWLEKNGLSTRSKHFHPESLIYGYAYRMDPGSFVKFGYKKRISDIDPQTYQKLLAECKGDQHVKTKPDEKLVEANTTTKPLTKDKNSQPASAVVKPPIAVVSDIERLVELYKSGLLSEEEFRRAKSKLLS